MTTLDRDEVFEVLAVLWRKLGLANDHYVVVHHDGGVDVLLDLHGDERDNLTTVLDVAWKYGVEAQWLGDRSARELRTDSTKTGSYGVRFTQSGVPIYLYCRLTSEPVPFAAVGPTGSIEAIRDEKLRDVALEDDRWSDFAAHAEGYL